MSRKTIQKNNAFRSLTRSFIELVNDPKSPETYGRLRGKLDVLYYLEYITEREYTYYVFYARDICTGNQTDIPSDLIVFTRPMRRVF